MLPIKELVTLTDKRIPESVIDSLVELFTAHVQGAFGCGIPDSANPVVSAFVTRMWSEMTAKGFHSERLGDYTYIRETRYFTDLFNDFSDAIASFMPCIRPSMGMSSNGGCNANKNPCC